MSRVRVENGRGDVAEGWGAIFLMDMWGWPTPKVAHPDREEAMRRLNQEFCQAAAQYQGYAHPIDIFQALESDLAAMSKRVCAEMNLAEQMPFLAALISAAPVDAALHDAFGNVNGINTYDGYGPDFMEHDLSHYLGASFRGKSISNYIRKENMPSVPVFHLVGGLDTLRNSEVKADSQQAGDQNRLPQSLEGWLERDGLTCLKVKLRGHDLEWDINRYLEVAQVTREVLACEHRSEIYFSADSNEQCADPQYMVEWIRKVQEKDPQAMDLLLYVEQPTERDLTIHRFDMHEL